MHSRRIMTATTEAYENLYPEIASKTSSGSVRTLSSAIIMTEFNSPSEREKLKKSQPKLLPKHTENQIPGIQKKIQVKKKF